MITTVLLAEPCPECKNTEAKIDDQSCYERWVETGNNPEDFNSVIQCEHLTCTRCGLTV